MSQLPQKEEKKSYTFHAEDSYSVIFALTNIYYTNHIYKIYRITLM